MFGFKKETPDVNQNTRNEMFAKLCTMIPNQVDNRLVIQAFEMMRKNQKKKKQSYPANTRLNLITFRNHLSSIKKQGGYIEDQKAYSDLFYGESTMAYSGCEIIAVFNALYSLLGIHPTSLPALIRVFEKNGMVYSGKFGTAPRALFDYLVSQNFPAEFSTSPSHFDDIGERYESFILTMYNDGNDLSQEVHTIHISKKDGEFTAHNVYGNGRVVGPCCSITEVLRSINDGKSKGICLIGARKK